MNVEGPSSNAHAMNLTWRAGRPPTNAMPMQQPAAGQRRAQCYNGGRKQVKSNKASVEGRPQKAASARAGILKADFLFMRQGR